MVVIAEKRKPPRLPTDLNWCSVMRREANVQNSNQKLLHASEKSLRLGTFMAWTLVPKAENTLLRLMPLAERYGFSYKDIQALNDSLGLDGVVLAIQDKIIMAYTQFVDLHDQLRPAGVSALAGDTALPKVKADPLYPWMDGREGEFYEDVMWLIQGSPCTRCDDGLKDAVVNLYGEVLMAPKETVNEQDRLASLPRYSSMR